VALASAQAAFGLVVADPVVADPVVSVSDLGILGKAVPVDMVFDQDTLGKQDTVDTACLGMAVPVGMAYLDMAYLDMAV